VLFEWVTFSIVVAAGAVTVWLQARQRLRDERAGAPGTAPSFSYARMLGVFLPLVGLLTLIQLYIEQPKALYLLLALPAALALILGLVPGESRDGARKHGRRRR